MDYLVLIHAIDFLPQLFDIVVVSPTVRGELDREETPALVRQWIANPPLWLHVRAVAATQIILPRSLHRGERDAINLVLQARADLLLMDDRAGITAARALGLSATGTLGLLAIAQEHGFITLDEAYARLTTTNFRYRRELMDALLARYSKRRGDD